MTNSIAKFDTVQPFMQDDKIALSVVASTKHVVVLTDKEGKETINVPLTKDFKVGSGFAELSIGDNGEYTVSGYFSKAVKRKRTGSGSVAMFKTSFK